MEENKFYSLPMLPYGHKDLEPYMSSEQLKIHHDKHHAAYVKGANNILEKLNTVRSSNQEYDVKAIAKELSFNIGGYVLHSLFWNNLAPAGRGGGEPIGTIKEVISEQFKSFKRFKEEFTKAAIGVEGSGWATLALCPETKRIIIMQIEKHNINIYPAYPIVLVLDMFEHAYYIDYKNEKSKYMEAFWNIINWHEVNRRLENLK